MQIVIDIPEEIYNSACTANNIWDMRMAGFVCSAIANGIPLQKGHGRLIDAKAYEQDIRKHYFDNELVIRSTEIALSNAPTIIETESEE